MNVKFKNAEVFIETIAVGYHPKMIDLLWWLLLAGHEIVVTSGHRKGDPGVHGAVPCRGMDIRSSVFQNPGVVVASINSVWQYDPARPEMKCAIRHNVGRGDHIHLQVHPNTMKRIP